MKVLKKFFPVWVGIATALIIAILFILMGYAPFGGNSLAKSDANVQYLDFFAYLKDLLSGKASVGYSFGKSLGDNNIGIISYYLLSPFNLLVVFFNKANLHSFFNLITALKIGLTACTMTLFLKQRFLQKLHHTTCKHYLFISLFGISYALSQWFISQSSNTMWLDGGYMLPLILLGIYRLVQQKKLWILSVTVGLSIIFNWYSGGINCLFSFLWLLFEIYLEHIEPNQKIDWRLIVKIIGRYLLAMVLALAISSVIFLPTIEVMGGTSRGQLELSSLFNLSFRGNILSAIQTYSLGAGNSMTAVSLFCGSLTLLGVIGCFITKQFSHRKKISYAVLLAILLLLFYWTPGFMLFSLLKNADSFYYRYAYVAIFALIFIATDFFINGDFQKIKKSIFFTIFATYSISLLLLNYINPGLTNLQYACYSIFFFLLTTIVISTFRNRRVSYFFLIFIVLAELVYNTALQMKKVHTDDAYTFREYAELTEQQINAIESQDDSTFRISQTTTRNPTADNLTANYDEPLAYNYWSLTSYTSNPNEKQMVFLDKVGYLTGSVNMNIVNTSLLGIDSLLGVKYILSPYYINGLQKTDLPTGYNDKTIYRNPYALPLAFKYQNNDYDLETETWTSMNSINPFEYQNRIFKKISNTDTNIYKPIDSHVTETDQGLVYTLDIPRGNYAIYANIPWYAPTSSKINLNGVYEMGYAMWLSPSALYVPIRSGDTNATVTIQTNSPDSFKLGEEQFYALNLDKLQKISDTLKTGTPDVSVIEDGYAYFELTADDNEYLFTSIPADKNWAIKLNDQEITPELFADAFYIIPLSQGYNKIEMTYKIRTAIPGIAISFIGIISTSAIGLHDSLRKKCHPIK